MRLSREWCLTIHTHTPSSAEGGCSFHRTEYASPLRLPPPTDKFYYMKIMPKKQIPLNAIDNGETAPCLTSHYYKVGWSDFLPDIPCKHLSILEIMEEPQIKQIGSYSPSSACNAKVLDPDGICPTLLNHKGAEPAILAPQRTEIAKRLRREGIETFAHRQLVPREDGVCNTLTSVQHDNMLLEPKLCAIRGRGENNTQQLEIGGDVANCITSVTKDSLVIGSNQANAYVGSVEGVAPCVNAAAGMGGGHVAMITEEPKIIGYSRDSKGRVISHHLKEEANTLNCGGGSTAQYVAEQLKEIAQAGRKGEIGVTIHPNGDLRPYRADRADKPTASEFDTKNENNLANTVTSAHGGNVYGETTMYRIRKLTPKECFRLMDVDDADIEKLQSYPWESYEQKQAALDACETPKERKRLERQCISKSKQYALAGNSIVASCLYHIFRTLFIPNQPENERTQYIQKSLFDL